MQNNHNIVSLIIHVYCMETDICHIVWNLISAMYFRLLGRLFVAYLPGLVAGQKGEDTRDKTIKQTWRQTTTIYTPAR